MSICQYEHADSSTLEGYFFHQLGGSAEGCRMYIWYPKKVLENIDNGLEYHHMKVCEKIFVVCCCLYIFLLEERERGSPKVGRGSPIGDDGMFFDGHTERLSTESVMRAKWVSHYNLGRGVCC